MKFQVLLVGSLFGHLAVALAEDHCVDTGNGYSYANPSCSTPQPGCFFRSHTGHSRSHSHSAPSCGPSYGPVSRSYSQSSPSYGPVAPAAPTYMSIQRAIMEPETVMVPTMVMMPQTVMRQRMLIEQVPVAQAPVASPRYAPVQQAPIQQGPAFDIPPAPSASPAAVQAPAAQPYVAAPAAPQYSAPLAAPQYAAPAASPSCAGSPGTQMALMALMLSNNREQAPARAPTASSSESRDRINRMESKIDRLERLIVSLSNK